MAKPPAAIRAMVAHVAIREYAAASWAYEIKDESWLSDRKFDKLCAWLLKNYDWIKEYDINNYLHKGELEAGTGMKVARKVCGQTLEYAEMKIGVRLTTTGGRKLAKPNTKDKKESLL